MEFLNGALSCDLRDWIWKTVFNILTLYYVLWASYIIDLLTFFKRFIVWDRIFLIHALCSQLLFLILIIFLPIKKKKNPPIFSFFSTFFFCKKKEIKLLRLWVLMHSYFVLHPTYHLHNTLLILKINSKI